MDVALPDFFDISPPPETPALLISLNALPVHTAHDMGKRSEDRQQNTVKWSSKC